AVSEVLRAFLLMQEKGPEARERLFLLAEPGLVALLLYASCRLLPEPWTRDLTFSTYEETSSTFRDLLPRDATALGTYSRNKEKGLDADYLNRKGYGVDTFLDKASLELRVPDKAALKPQDAHLFDGFLSLAAEGKEESWAVIDRGRAAWGRASQTPSEYL